MEDDELISSNSNNKPSITEDKVDDDEDEDLARVSKCESFDNLIQSNLGTEKVAEEGGGGGGDEAEAIIESKERGLGLEEEVMGSCEVEGVIESKEVGLGLDEEVMGDCEVEGLVGGSGGVVVGECGVTVVDRVGEERVEEGGGGGEEESVGGSVEGMEGKEMGLEEMGNSEVGGLGGLSGGAVVDEVMEERVEEEEDGSGDEKEKEKGNELGLESEELMGNSQGMEERVEEEHGGGEEKGEGGGGSVGIDEEKEVEGMGMESEEMMRNVEGGGSGGLSGEGMVAKCDEPVVDQVTEGAMIASQGGDRVFSDVFGRNDDQAVAEGGGVEVVDNLMSTDSDEVVQGREENANVELQQATVVEKNMNTEIVEMSSMERDIGADGALVNEDSIVHKIHHPQTDSVELTTADYDAAMDGVILSEQEKMVMDICVDSSTRMVEGGNSEHGSTPCDTVVGTRTIAMAEAEKDGVKGTETKENLVDVSQKEKEKQVELVESDVSKYVKDEVEKNDEFKDVMEGNSAFGDNKIDDEKEVGMNVDGLVDSKGEDSESTVSESHADKSGKDDEAEGTKEIGTGDIRMKTEADSMEITKDEDPEATADSDVPQTPQDEEMVAEEETNADTEVETETDVAESGKAGGEKRKRGKNRSSANPKSTPKSRKTTEEDVCFICLDGGALVLCDRRGCPKAYHPSCVNRDDSFFVGKGSWNCGWHQCSICEKNALYFCYTCPYSLCKGCCKDGVLSCVRGKKGFCETCMKVVKLLENNDEGVKDDQVDFDDQGCWEFLFRDYYTELRSKLSLSSAEIAEAKSPWKGLDNSAGKDDKLGSSKQKSLEPPSDHADDAGVDAENSDENEEAVKPRRRKVKKRLKMRGKGQTSSRATESLSDEGRPVVTEWASKELLEFVMHMKNGDRSILSEFDVQALLLEYIKRSNLRDPRQKSKIICDSRLQSLFGKPRVGHFEMLKLLESHFFIKEDSHTDDVQGSVVDTNSEPLEVDKNADTPKGTKEKKRKSRKKGRRPQSNLDDYAAIDMHNISLIYLRRKLMEDLLEDSETFKDKIVGTFVRIRISGSAQKQDIYRLVQVVDTSNAAEPYKVGKKTTHIMVEILNLNKTEVISIDTISNQDFTEDECKRLRQSIKCGLINRLTVGDILDKATELQTAKVNDWLDSEVVRLSHLRDRASDMGHKKELRECVEKLQLLKTPEERQRRLNDEIPEIHVDPKMDPTYESEEDDSYVDENRQDVNTKIRGPGSRGGRGQISPGSDILSKDPWSGGANYANMNWELDTSNNRELDRNLSSKNVLNKGASDTTYFGEVHGETSRSQVRDYTKPESINLDRFGTTLGSDTPSRNIHDVQKSESLSSSISNQAPALAKEAELTKVNESEKTWHYKDPSGKIQGPFSMVQLRKWSNTGYFPSELKVWRATEKPEDSVLLTDALSGEFRKESTAAAITLPSTLSANLTNIMASLEHAREQQDREKRLKTERDASANLLSHIVLPAGVTDPPIEQQKLSIERYSQSESSSHPSPTPLPNNPGVTREGGSLSSATSYFARNGALPSPTAGSQEYQNRSFIPSSGLRSCETIGASKNEPISTGLSGVQVGHSVVSNTSQNSQAVVNGDTRAIQGQGNVAVAQDSFAPQTVSNQNSATGAHGWGTVQSQKVDTNAAIPLQPQLQSYGQWGNIPTAAGYTHPGNFPQGNQPNMQFPALPNSSWAVGAPENNTTTAPAPRPENPNQSQNPNPNYGWGVMQGNQNAVWVGAPPVNGNVNWGVAPPQGPPPGNQIMGWTMPPVNLGAAVPGQLPGGANPGWTSGTGNPPVQGLPPAGNVNQNWVAPNTGNTPTNVHMPTSGSGWPPSTGNLGPPVRGPVPGNGNQGLSTPPQNQGPWGTDQNHSGSKFSSQRDQSSHGGEYGYGGNRFRNRPSSFGNGGPGGPSRQVTGRHQMPCPYNHSGRCRKGAACNYMHT